MSKKATKAFFCRGKKVSFCFASLFALLCLLTAGVNSDRGLRAALHNSCWSLKALLVAALMVAAFVVPVSHAGQVRGAGSRKTGRWIV